MAVTIRDVARAAGVHISTVSRAFSNPHLVSPATRERVMAAAAELGYRPNPAARSLITGRTHNLGLIVADIANPYFPSLIKAAERQARQRGYYVFVTDTDEDPAVEAELVNALANQVDGIVLCAPRMTNREIEEKTDAPLVVINRKVNGVPAVLMDLAGGARAALEHLAGLGHRDIVFLSGPPSSWTSREVRRGATASAAASGARLSVIGPGQPTEQGGEAAADQVASSGATAVLAHNDLMALGLVNGLARHGMRVPDDISVIGIDNISASRFATPKLTTLATPAAAAGRAAVDMLLREDSSSAAQLILGTTLIPRESTGPAPRHRIA